MSLKSCDCNFCIGDKFIITKIVHKSIHSALIQALPLFSLIACFIINAMYIYARKIFLVGTLQLRMERSREELNFPNLFTLLRFSHLVVKNVYDYYYYYFFIRGCPKFDQKLEVFFNPFVVENKRIKTQFFSRVHDSRLGITFSLCRLRWL